MNKTETNAFNSWQKNKNIYTYTLSASKSCLCVDWDNSMAGVAPQVHLNYK